MTSFVLLDLFIWEFHADNPEQENKPSTSCSRSQRSGAWSLPLVRHSKGHGLKATHHQLCCCSAAIQMIHVKNLMTMDENQTEGLKE